MKITLITGNFYNNIDGVSITIQKLCDFLYRHDIDIQVIAPFSGKKNEKPYPVIENKSFALPGRKEYQFCLSMNDAVKTEIKLFTPNLIHIVTPEILGLDGQKLAEELKIPIVSSFHTNFASYLAYYKLGFLKPLLNLYLRSFYKKCSHIYCPSESIYQEMIKNKIYHQKRIWSRGVDQTIFKPDLKNKTFKKELSIPNDDIIILWVSRLVKEKNFQLFLSVIKQINKKYKNITTLIVGDGPLYKKIPKQKNIYHLKHQSHEKLAKIYANSDIFLFPSISETFGSVTLEAMASGLPCIVAKSPGSKCLIKNNESGIVIDNINENTFIDATKKLLEKKNLRKEIGKNAYNQSLNYNTESENKELLRYYEELITKK